MDCPFTCLLVQEWQFCFSHSSGLLRADQWSISVSMMWTASRHNGDEHDGTCASELTSTLPTRTLDARPRVPVGLFSQSRRVVQTSRARAPEQVPLCCYGILLLDMLILCPPGLLLSVFLREFLPQPCSPSPQARALAALAMAGAVWSRYRRTVLDSECFKVLEPKYVVQSIITTTWFER